jgi:hypothetical protein
MPRLVRPRLIRRFVVNGFRLTLPQMMKITDIFVTEHGMNDALAALDKADKSARYAKFLKVKILDFAQRDPMIDALRSLVAYARAHPAGHIHSIMTKRGFLDVGLTSYSEEKMAFATRDEALAWINEEYGKTGPEAEAMLDQLLR